MSADSPKPRKKEGWRGIVIVGVLCGAFLWLWFSLDSTPEDVGPKGLTERALAEVKEAKETRPLLMEFDLLELSMLHLRAGDAKEAGAVAESINEPALQARGFKALALAALQKESGSMAAALTETGRIPDAALREAAQAEVLLEMARMGLGDVALENAKAPLVRAGIVRVLAETDGKETAQRLLPELEAAAAALPASGQAAMKTELTWIYLWLKQEEKAMALAKTLPEPARDEILSEHFRITRLEHPGQAPALLKTMPESIRTSLRIEALQLNGNLEKPEQLLEELASHAQAHKDAAAAAQAWIQVASAAWKVTSDRGAWLPHAQRAEEALKQLPAEGQAAAWQTLAALYFDALDIEGGRRAFQAAREAALRVADAATRGHLLVQLLDLGFKSSEPNEVQALIADARTHLAGHAPSAEDVSILTSILFKEGMWEDIPNLLGGLSTADRSRVLAELADLPVEATASQGFAVSQDKSLADIRHLAQTQGETEAAKLAMRKKPGADRARGWLEIAKGLVFRQLLEKEAEAAAAGASENPDN